MSRRQIPGQWHTNKDGTRSWVLPYRKPDTGKQASKSFRGKGAKERAERFYDELLNAQRTGTYTDPKAGRRQFREFAVEWAGTQDWSPATRDGFRSQLARFDRYLPAEVPHGKDVPEVELRLDQITEERLLRLRGRLLDAYSVSTAQITLSYTCAIMRAAHRRNLIPADPTRAIDRPKDRSGKRTGRQPEDVPTHDQVVAMLEHAPDEWRAGIALLASGLRISEMLAVHAEQYDRDTSGLAVDRQLSHDGKSFKAPKRDKPRDIVLPRWAAEAVEHHLDDIQGGGLMFRNRLGEPRRRDVFHDQVWLPTLEAAGIEQRFVPHSLRHFCASSLLAEGVAPVAVAGHLGDTLETLSKTYTHWMRDDRAVPAVALDRILGENRPLSIVPDPIVRSELDRNAQTSA